MITPWFGIPGHSHGMTLKLSPKKLLDKKWLLMMKSVGSRDKSTFNWLENKSIILYFYGSWYVVECIFMLNYPYQYLRLVGILSMLVMWGAEWKCRSPWLTKDDKLKNWLKRPKAVPEKTKLGSKCKWFKISCLWFFFENIFFGRTTLVHYSGICSRKPQSQ